MLDRYHLHAGDAFKLTLGKTYDVALLTSFLHHFDRQTCVAYLANLRSNLKPGGLVLTVDCIAPDERTDSFEACEFSLTMLCTTPHGDVYTFAEFSQMFQQAGYSESSLINLGEGLDQVIRTVA
ncbi:MAG: methyltransferase domain-containing protein [Pyrinomonadaceae bacterium]|nr:methyltransferase domain-containing protein [Pyrinomonadaceae bacterium]